MKKAMIAMSGGVDSSVAAKLMQDRGFACVGCTMKLYGNGEAGLERGHTCCALEDVEDARSVACRLHIPYYVFNYTREFKSEVMERFVCAYASGVTPNPCIDCNRYMKFRRLLDRALVLGCDCLATGHYARIGFDGERYVLKKAIDESRDQSYVLYFLTQSQLSRLCFPLGDMTKTQVRRIAAENGFINAGKADSQDICFVPDGDHAAFIERYTGKACPEGDFVDAQGKVMGRHRGVTHYTVGQRRGLGAAFGKAMYVKSIQPRENTVTLCENGALFSTTLTAGDFHWISGKRPEGEVRCRAKIRYRQTEQDAVAIPLEDGTVRIVFDSPQRAVTPGQAAVLYEGDVVLGGGVIMKT